MTRRTVITRRATLVHDAKAQLGEGPVWDHRKQLLYWLDIEKCKLYEYNPTTNQTSKLDFEEMIGAAVPTVSGKMLLAMESGLALYDFELSKTTALGLLENSDPIMRLNDGKCDPNGDLWIGSMHKEVLAETGNLYKVTGKLELSLEISKTTISNGMAWTEDQKTFYYIDTASYAISAFDYDVINGSISNGRTAFTVKKEFGGPDGMCIDREGMLWIAHWGGNCVRRWNPQNGEILEVIEVDAPHVTSCCFGGSALDTLYITTAHSGLDKEVREAFPLSGGLFKYEPGVCGFETTYFKDI